jgi:hypothetical protein
MVKVRNPFPGEEWRKENMEEQRGPAVLPLLLFPQGRIALPNLTEKLPNRKLAINDPRNAHKQVTKCNFKKHEITAERTAELKM